MAVLRITEWSGSEQQYDAAGQAAAQSVGLSDKMSFHAMCMIGENRFTVTEVWESEEALREWWPTAEPIITGTGVEQLGEERVQEIYFLAMGKPSEMDMSEMPGGQQQMQAQGA
jgi:heme-degrading monooxygenase HmoA